MLSMVSKAYYLIAFGSIILDLGLDVINGIKTLCVVTFGSFVLDLTLDLSMVSKPYV
jgi:hypothetical protein